MRRTALVLLLLVLPSPVAAQFTIPNNTSGAIVSANQALWMQTDIDSLVAGLNGRGVLYGGAVTAQTIPNMTVAVARATVQSGTTTAHAAAANVTIAAADASNPRIDVITVDTSGTLAAVAGTPAANPASPALASTRVPLAMVYVPANATSILSTYLTDKRVQLPAIVGSVVDVRGYGALCDGSTDDSTAIQAAVNAAIALGTAGTVLLPAASCAIASTVTLGDTSGGSTTEFISLKGSGAATTTLKWTGATNGTALRLKRNKYFKLEGFGVLNNGSRGTTVGINLTGFAGGTEVLAGIFERVGVDNFNIGFLDGPTSSTSEILYSQVNLFNCDYGWFGSQADTLDHQFHMLSLTSDGIGVYSHNVNVTVDGGSSTGSTSSDFYFDSCVCALNHFRSESANRTIKAKGNDLSLRVESVLAHTSSNGDGVLVDLGDSVSFGDATIEDSQFQGKIQITSYGSTLRIRNSTSMSGSSSAYLSVPFEVTGTHLSGAYESLGNRYWQGIAYHDTRGIFGAQSDFASGTYSPQVVCHAWGDRGSYSTDAGCQLRRTTMLAEGSDAEGTNLRVQVKFATSATANFTFIRTITANYSAGTWTVASGAIYAGDEGKYGTMGGNGKGPIYSVNTGAQTFKMSPDCGSCTPASITIGRNEPDANYLLMLGCDKQETFSWSAKATTGFTLTSSNAASVATCDVLVVR